MIAQVGSDLLSAALDLLPDFGSGGEIPTEARARALDAAHRTAVSHPLLWDVRRRVASGGVDADVLRSRPLTSPIEVAAEQIWTVCSLISAGIERREPGMLTVAKSIYAATPFLWLAEPTRAARSMPVPSHVFGRDALPTSPAWFTFDRDYTGDEFGWDAIHGVLLAHALVAGSGPGLGMAWVGRTHDGSVAISLAGIAYGSRVEVPEGGISPVGLLSFLNSPYIPKESRRLPRQARKQTARAGYREPNAVTYIDLRPAVGHDREDAGAARGGGEHSHRWMVRGHHRAQWYPSSQSHRVIWIAPHLKGPADKPLLVKPYRVVR